MNILPIVLSFLFVISISLSCFFSKNRMSQNIIKTHIGLISAQRDALNNYEHEYYKSLPGKSLSKRKKNEDIKPAVKEPKNRQPNYENAKLNIYPLLTKGKNEASNLYFAFTSLITFLYSQKQFFYYEKNINPAFAIADKLIEHFQKILLQKKSSDISLEKISFGDSELQYLFYKMLKGSKNYNFNNKTGIPSLLDFIEIIPNKNSRVFLYDAPRELIASLTSLEIAVELAKLQTDPKTEYSEKLLIDLGQKYHVPISNSIVELFDYSKPKYKPAKKRLVRGVDPTSTIIVDRNLHLKG